MNIKTSTSQNAGWRVRGFTLIEVMVSVALLALMLAALYPAFILGFANVKTTREEERATQIVTQKLESLRLCTWTSLSNYPSTFVDYYTPQTTAKGTVYGGTITIVGASALPAGYRDKVKLVTISVYWTNYVNSAPVVHNRQMQTLAAYWGLQNSLWGNGS